MANSKSNIYPIQLQGAELNLNKYDAEIKQYSGFNKNNSPFVGGGLSPIFRKDETVEGATSKNTYIAPNGDVYRVKVENNNFNFYKNDIRLNSSSTCIKKSKIETDIYTLRVFSEKFALKYINKIVYINDIEIGEYEQPSYFSNDDIAYYFSNGIFDKINGTNYFIFFTVVTKSLKVYIFDVDTAALIASNTVTLANYTEKVLPVTIFKEIDGNDFTIFHRYELATWQYYRRVNFTFTGSALTINNAMYQEGPEINITDANSHTYSDYFSNRVSHYVFDGFPINRMYIKSVDNKSFNGKSVAYSFYINASQQDNSHFFNVTYDSSLDIGTISGSIDNADENNIFLNQIVEEGFNGLFHNYVFQFFDNSGVTHFRKINYFSDAKAAVVSLQEKTIRNYTRKIAVVNHGSFVRCDFGKNIGGSSLPDIYFLLNNSSISGISSNANLCTDWNSIEARSIVVFNRNTVVFKEGEDFYKLTYSYNFEDVFLKKCENQIVCNCTDGKSWFIDSNKTTRFGYAYNFSLERSTVSTLDTFTQDSVNNYWVAAAVNEYNLKDNASIIINSIGIYELNISQLYAYTNPCFIGTYFNNINYYQGTDTLPTYYATFYYSGRRYIDKNLVDLPFPSDTNGNVQYSPSLFSEIKDIYGNDAFIKSGGNFYPLMKYNNETVMSFYLASGIEGLQEGFIVQGQFYGIINNGLYSLRYNNGVVEGVDFVVSVEGLKFCGNTPYQAFFFSKTNRCLYIFNGANVLQQSQFIDIYADIKFYKYNPATHSIFMVTDDCVLVFSSFGTFRLDVPNVEEIYLLENGIVLLNNVGTFMRIKYYNTENGYTKQNVILETCFYGMNNQTVTINDCLYMRLFSEEYESGNIEVSAVTLANEGKKTERTTFKIKPNDWDKETHSIYLRYQPKEQRGLGISFKINSPFKICSLSVGSIADSILIDKVSKGAINAPYNNKSSIEEW